MIIVRLMGGIGNQLFQYALGRCLAYRRHTELKLDLSICEFSKSWHHNYYRLGYFNVQENLATPEEISRAQLIDEKSLPSGFKPEILNAPDNVLLHGYWQAGDRYFAEAADLLRSDLTPKKPLQGMSKYWLEKISTAECAVAVHIRHGDFMMPLIRNYIHVLPMGYYLKCIEILQTIYQNLSVFVFSDDLEWAKNNFKTSVPTYFVEGCEDDNDDFYLMSRCKHNIAASSFSWWAAWLNPNPDKKVFVPRRVEDYKSIEEHDPNIPKNFIRVFYDHRIPAHVEFPPMLSVILYIENNLDTAEAAMASILAQNFNDYELIVIDASTDGSGNICRKFTDRENVVVFKESRTIGKFAAWNKGLDIARGDYVLFLTGKDRIIVDTARLLAQFLYDYLKFCIEAQRGKYISYENYLDEYPDVINSVGYMPAANFAANIDAPFQNLKTFVGAAIDNAQKLTMLATQQINNLIGTKIFKRGFLNENAIRFPKATGGGELIFLVNSFLRTDNIIFMPQIFYGRLN